MSNQFLKLRRSAVPGKVPDTSSLDFGELALNTYDGLAFMKKSGSLGEQIIAIGTGTSGNISGSQFYIPVFSGSTSLVASSIYQSGSFTAINYSGSPEDPTNPDVLYVHGTGIDTSNIVSAHSDINGFIQINVENYNSSGNASSDIVATADNGNDSINYIDMGINSSGYNAGIVGGQNDAYVYSTGNDLLIGNASAGKQVIIFNGGLDSQANARVFIHDQGTVGINTNTYNPLFPPALQIQALDTNTTNLIQAYGSVNNYLQLAVINANIGTTASADIVAYNDLDPGNQQAGFIDMGIASTTYVRSDIYPSAAGDAYVFTDSGHLLLGPTSASGDTKITLFAGGINEIDNAKLILYGNNRHEMSGSLRVSGSITAQSFTGSLFGTASWALNAFTSSYIAPGATASYALTASYAINAISSSYVSGSAAIVTNLTSSYDALINGYTLGRGNGNTNTNYVFGFEAGQNLSASVGRTILIGHQAGKNLTWGQTQVSTGTDTIAIGHTALSNASSSYNGVFIGWGAGGNIRSGSQNANNTFVGNAAGYYLISGTNNTSIGSISSYLFHGDANTSLGVTTFSIRSGSYNTMLGYQASLYQYSGSYNTVVGVRNTIGLLNNYTPSDNNTVLGSNITIATAGISNNIILADGQGNIKYRWDTVQNNVYGNLAVTGSVTATTGFTGSFFGTASWVENFLTSSVTSASVSITSSYALTASFGANFTASNLLVTNTITAQSLIVQTITSSVEYVTGSTQFGSVLSNTHQFTGSVSITGSLTVNNNTVVTSNQTGSMSVLSASYAQTASYGLNAISSSYAYTASSAVSSSYALTASYIVSGITVTSASYAYTASSAVSAYTASSSITASYAFVASSGTGSFTGSFIGVHSGSLFGTASWATNFITSSVTSASYAYTASSAVSAYTASSAVTSSYAFVAASGTGSFTGSFIGAHTGSLFGTASWASNFLTSSVTSASYAYTASSAVTSSYAFTASYALNAGGASSITIADEGTAQGTATFLNFTGAGVTATVSSNTASISIPGGAGAAFPYTGSAQITGSLGVTGSTSVQILNIGTSQFNNTSSVTSAGTTIVSTLSTSSYSSCFYNYTIASASNARSGQVMSVWNGSTIRYTEVATTDIGNTATASFAVTLSGANVQLSFTAPGVWTVKNISNLL